VWSPHNTLPTVCAIFNVQHVSEVGRTLSLKVSDSHFCCCFFFCQLFLLVVWVNLAGLNTVTLRSAVALQKPRSRVLTWQYKLLQTFRGRSGDMYMIHTSQTRWRARTHTPHTFPDVTTCLCIVWAALWPNTGKVSCSVTSYLTDRAEIVIQTKATSKTWRILSSVRPCDYIIRIANTNNFHSLVQNVFVSPRDDSLNPWVKYDCLLWLLKEFDWLRAAFVMSRFSNTGCHACFAFRMSHVQISAVCWPRDRPSRFLVAFLSHSRYLPG
jgi:hypothetical protein